MVRSHRELILNWFRAKGQFSSGVVEGRMGSAPPGHWKSLCIMHLATCPNHNKPTDSADEAPFVLGDPRGKSAASCGRPA